MDDMFNNDPVAFALKRIGGKWKPHLLWGISHDEPMRFSKALNNIPISERVLAQTLRELEMDGLLERKVFPEVPPRVEYYLTDIGKSAIPILATLYDWGRARMLESGIAPDPVGEIRHGHMPGKIPGQDDCSVGESAEVEV